MLACRWKTFEDDCIVDYQKVLMSPGFLCVSCRSQARTKTEGNPVSSYFFILFFLKKRGTLCLRIFLYYFFLKMIINFFLLNIYFNRINFQKYVLIYKLYTKFLFSKVSYVNASGKITGFFGSSEYFPQ